VYQGVGTYAVTGGTGKFAGATGQGTFTGTGDFINGTSACTFDGTIFAPRGS
jgi:hypothetical protein